MQLWAIVEAGAAAFDVPPADTGIKETAPGIRALENVAGSFSHQGRLA